MDIKHEEAGSTYWVYHANNRSLNETLSRLHRRYDF